MDYNSHDVIAKNPKLYRLSNIGPSIRSRSSLISDTLIVSLSHVKCNTCTNSVRIINEFHLHLEFFHSFAQTGVALANPTVKLWDTHRETLKFPIFVDNF